MVIYPVINVFSTNVLTSRLHIYNHSIVTFGIRGLCLGHSNASHVDSLDRFRKSVVYEVRIDVCIFKRDSN